jgi:hypothetical protein
VRLRQLLADLPGPLDLDLEHHPVAPRPILDLGQERAVAIAGVGGVLEELTGLEPAFELLRGEEVVVAPVVLPRPRRPRRGRNRQAQARLTLEQRADEGALADARRTRDHEDGAHARER